VSAAPPTPTVGAGIERTEPYIAATVQAAPVYLDARATVQRVAELMHEAAAHGAKLVAFPEVFVAGYPYWNWLMSPVEGSAWFERLFRSSIDVPGPHCDALLAAARSAGVHAVVGVNERAPHSAGAVYNSMLVISDEGRLLGVHRKLVPTWAEKLSWTGGDGSSLHVHHTAVGPLGMLACGENTNPLARFSLLAQGELVHIASYIALPVAPADYDMVDAIRLRAAAHSFEGKVFTLVSCSTIDAAIVDAVAGDDADRRALLSRPHSAFSGIFGPAGTLISDPLVDDDGIAYAEIDLRACIQPKQMHDIVGHYNRFDVFDLRVDTRPRRPLTVVDAAEGPHESLSLDRRIPDDQADG
jgi:aliphatic nitrilase